MLWLDPNDPTTPVVAAIREFAQKNRCYNKTAFRERLVEAGQSAPEALRIEFDSSIIDDLPDRWFCEAIELKHCQPIPKTYACRCNKVMISWEDNTNTVCDRVTIGMIKTTDRGWDCNVVLGNEHNRCSLKREVPCDSWPGIDDTILQPGLQTRGEPIKHEAPGEFIQFPRFANMKDDAASSGDKSTGAEDSSAGQPSSIQPSGQAADWNDEDL